MSKASIIFILALGVISLTRACPESERMSTINLVVNDFLLQVKINGNELNIPDIQNIASSKPAQIKVNLNPGDKVSITAKNNGDWGQKNPAYILATINYRNPAGHMMKLSTNDLAWTCDNAKPQVLGQNSDFCARQWAITQPVREIESNAKMIWNPDHRGTVVCEAFIPCY